MTHIQNTAPGPPVRIAPATPTMMPVLTWAAQELMDCGVQRYFIVCPEKWRQEVLDDLPGCDVTFFDHAEAALSAAGGDVVMVPGPVVPVYGPEDGRSVYAADSQVLLARLRAEGSDIPVLFLTARDSVADRVEGLDLGADDYLVKPFAFEELLARIRAMTRKHAGSRTDTLTVGDLVLDTRGRTASRAGREIPLLPKEYAILEHLVRHAGTVLSREQLEDRIWNYEKAGSSNNIDGYMSRLRKKIDADVPESQRLLHTVRGSGWVLRAPKEGGTP